MLHSPGIDALCLPRTDGQPLPQTTLAVRADILSLGQPVFTGSTDVKMVGGPVNQSRSQFARRSCTVTILDPTLVPNGGLTDALRLGNEIRLWRGISSPLPAPELLPQITGAITNATVAYDNGQPVGATVQIADRCRALTRARFLRPLSLPSGSARNMLSLLILRKPWLTLRFAEGVDDVTVPKQTFDRDRDAAVKTLAAALGAEVFCDGLGEFVVQPIPDVNGTPTLQVYGGDGGNLITGARSISDDGVFNGVVVTGQAPGGTGEPPTSDATLDMDPTSVTNWTGPFDEVPGFFDSNLITSKAQANLVAAAQLRNAVGAAKSVTFTMTPHPGLEVGDLVGVTFPDGTYEQHLIDSLSMPLDTGLIQASTRASRDTEVS